jgi:hypothetical protein
MVCCPEEIHMNERDLINEIQELRRAIEAGFIVLTMQRIQVEHPHRSVGDCQIEATQLVESAMDRIRPAAMAR